MIHFEKVNLWRRTQEEYAYDLKRTIFAVIERRYRPPTKRRVLHDVSFDIAPGEKVGIIGPNGSGKSTALKIVAGILKPSTGSVFVQGEIAPLIELGAGFDPDLSVIENIMYYSVLLGRSRIEARESIDGILDFSGLYDHANEPLKALSSGMVARLGFAIATERRPDILILDEVFSVGDESFRRKSAERVGRFWDEQSTILVVSHDTDFVRRMTSRAILLEEGVVIADGPSDEVSQLYEFRIASAVATGGHSAVHLDAERIATLEGRVFRGNGTTWEEQKIFLIQAGTKRWIRDSESLSSNGIDWPADITFVEGGILEKIPDGLPVGSIAVFHVDEPAADATVESDGFVLKGWLHPHSIPQVDEIRVVSDSTTLGGTREFFVRDDVCAHLGIEPCLPSGFEIKCRLPLDRMNEGSAMITVLAIERSGDRSILDTRTVRLALACSPSMQRG
jgi:ABC-type polysaccharide/polyol phosphate transport system ATPase subunit